MPVGEVPMGGDGTEKDLPRTHLLALAAADEAMAGACFPPEAVIIGITTGGILTTEENLKARLTNPAAYCYHGAGTVAELIAKRLGCKGPAITVSNACSSGAVAIKIALDLLRSGKANRVLAGGADCICRLTYYGFKSLQLVDPEGARPFDRNRKGMSVGEGAAMLLLEASTVREPPEAESERIGVLGGGLSCDAFHPAKPHPEGQGALAAMQAALKEAVMAPQDIDYLNLHGTGTSDNDLSEARAIRMLFGDRLPPLSSAKGALGHSLAAAGAIEAVLCAIGIDQGLMPANTGCQVPDPELGLSPLPAPQHAPLRVALSNSIGFGGNNAALVIGKTGHSSASNGSNGSESHPKPLRVAGVSCITGYGHLEKTLLRLASPEGGPPGTTSLADLSAGLPPAQVRRLKRLPRMALALALAAHRDAHLKNSPGSVFWGTGWGPLSETYDFLMKLQESDEKFTSPTDFIGSVHNAPAGQVAMLFGANDANITLTGGDYSFEQALMSAQVLRSETESPLLVIGADEYHGVFSPLLDRSVSSASPAADGGAALCLIRSGTERPESPRICLDFFQTLGEDPDVIPSLVASLSAQKSLGSRFCAVMVGIPAGFREQGEGQLRAFLCLSNFTGPVMDYRKFTGEFASATAVATALAASFCRNGNIPSGFFNAIHRTIPTAKKEILVLGLGKSVTAICLG
jgi:3-oxoacyl-[acyl-carrier-protein] synthase-1/3-oxoacyl-[acyl-carrier-protein] synthase II